MNTQALVKACLKGNEQAQKQLYDAYAGQMMGVCYRFTKSTEDAEDVLQEGFIKVFGNLAQFKGEGELGAWIRKIMVNTSLAYLKKHKSYSNELLIKEDHMHVISDDNPEINIHVKELIEMIRQLPVGYQTIFNMHAIDGYSHVEIGQMLGISEATSRSQYMRARKQLICWLQKQPGEFKKHLMPEHNFEQQARDMANGFDMKPRPEVWQNVRNAIQQPKRKRRFVLWWWLLPLGLLGGGVAWYVHTKTNNGTQVVKMAPVHQSSEKQQTATLNQSERETINGEQTGDKKDTAANANVLLSNNKIKQQLPATTEESKKVVANNKHIKKEALNKNIAVKNEATEHAVSSNESFRTNTIIASKSSTDNITNTTLQDSSIALQQSSSRQIKDSLKNNFTKQDSSSFTSSTTLSSPSVQHQDTAALQQADSAVSNQSTGVNHSPTVLHKKETKFHLGVIAEGGIASKRSSVLSLAGLEKSYNSAYFDLNGATLGQVITPGPNNGFHYDNNIKDGVAFAVGIALQKAFASQHRLFADVAYHYQSIKLSTAVYKDSLLLNNAFSTLSGSYNAAQAFHFTSLFAGINWHFINTKNIQFGVSAGADNLFLLRAHQHINGVTGNGFSSRELNAQSDSLFSVNNFYRYQPSLFAGVLVNIQMGTRQLQLEPFTRSSFKPFDKHSNSGNNHLFSAGIRAVYYFK